MKEQIQLFAEAKKQKLTESRASPELMEAIEVVSDVEAFDIGYTDVKGYAGWNGAENASNVFGHYMITKNKNETQELSQALTTLRVMRYRDVLVNSATRGQESQDISRVENVDSWIIPVKIRENIILDKALEVSWLMTDEKWQVGTLPEFVKALQDITDGL